MDRDTIQNFDTIDFGPEFERHDTEVVTERLSTVDVDPEDAEPTLRNSIKGTVTWRDARYSDPLIPPPRR